MTEPHGGSNGWASEGPSVVQHSQTMPADTTHPVFQPHQPKDDRIRVWRYMDLPKLIGLLQSKSLHLTRADTLDDPFEGRITHINRLADEAKITELLAHPANGHTRESLRRFFNEAIDVNRQNTYVSCWCSGETESATMWKAYGDKGVVVQSTYNKLRDNLPGPDPKGAETVYMACVRYLNYQGSDWIPRGNAFFPFIHKRKQYEEEKEVRIIYSGLGQRFDGPGISISIEMGKVIDDIRCYPGAPVWIREILTDLVRKYGLDLDVSPSSLDAIPIM